MRSGETAKIRAAERVENVCTRPMPPLSSVVTATRRSIRAMRARLNGEGKSFLTGCGKEKGRWSRKGNLWFYLTEVSDFPLVRKRARPCKNLVRDDRQSQFRRVNRAQWTPAGLIDNRRKTNCPFITVGS